MPRTAFQAFLLMLAIAAGVTLPEEAIPSVAWRVHFGVMYWCFGAMFGFACGLWLERR